MPSLTDGRKFLNRRSARAPTRICGACRHRRWGTELL